MNAMTPLARTFESAPLAAREKTVDRSDAKSSFSAWLKSALDAVNQAQQDADTANALLAVGQIEDIHQVMILTEKANIALQMTIAIRNKVIEAYQEISRMQV